MIDSRPFLFSTISSTVLVANLMFTSPLVAQACPYQVQAGAGYSIRIERAPKVGSKSVAYFYKGFGGGRLEGVALALSRSSGLTAVCKGRNNLAVSVVGKAKVKWSFDDLKFSSAKSQRIGVVLNLQSFGTKYGSAAYRLDVRLYSTSPNKLIHTNFFNSLTPGNGVPPFPLTVMTNQTYRLEIETYVWAQGNQGAASISNHLTFKKMPFTLPSGVTADSVKAKIKSNSYSVPKTITFPTLSANRWTSTTTGSVNYSQSNNYIVPPLLVIGSGTLPTCNFAIGPHLALSTLRPALILPLPMDANRKTATLKFPIPASAKGAKLVLQAVQIDALKIEKLYGSNPVPIVVR